jgi:opacity protein-like surface antigen
MCSIRKRVASWVVAQAIAGAVLATPTTARAEGWRFELQPYAYVPVEVKGSATIGAHEVPIDLGLGNLADVLRFAAATRFEGWKDQWGFAADMTYLNVGEEGTLAGVPFDLTSQLFVGDLLGQYRLNPWQLADAKRKSWAIDLGLGGRVNHLEHALDLAGRSLEAGETRLQALGSVGLALRLSPHWALAARSVLALPDTSFNVGGGVEWSAGVIALKLGYRYDQLSRQDAPTLNVHEHGPYLGVGLRFGEGSIY